MRGMIAALLLVSAGLAGGADRPVMVGGSSEFDACMTQARIGGAKSGAISVMAVPGGVEVARLNNGRWVIACDTAEIRGESWSGVVYPDEGMDIGQCGLGSPIVDQQPYVGPCRSGWVRSKWLTDIIGKAVDPGWLLPGAWMLGVAKMQSDEASISP